MRSNTDTGAVDELRQQDVSEPFIAVLNWDEDDRRNSVKELVEQTRDVHGEIDTDKIRDRGGHFATALIDGDLEEAWYRADGDNTYILSSLYSESRISSWLRDDRVASDYKGDEFLHESWR